MAKRRIVSFSITDDGKASFGIFTRPDAAGKQAVAETLTVAPDDIHDSVFNTVALYGLATIASNNYNRLDDPDASAVRAVFDALLAKLRDGTWTPGRSFAESAPSDLEMAIAEATGRPVHIVQEHIASLLAKPKLTADGQPVTDKAGRVTHLYKRKTVLDNLANDPKVKPVLARILRDKAARLAKEKSDDRGALDLLDFGDDTATQAAAAAQ